MNTGIYLITNIVNNKRYIGSAINISGRWSQHKSELNNNKHKNGHLQAAYNKYGSDNFKFEIILLCSKDSLLHYEQTYIDLCKPEYNILKTAGSSFGYKHSEEAKEKISDSKLGKTPWNKGIERTEEEKIKMSNNRKGKGKQPKSEQTKQRMKDAWILRKKAA